MPIILRPRLKENLASCPAICGPPPSVNIRTQNPFHPAIDCKASGIDQPVIPRVNGILIARGFTVGDGITHDPYQVKPPSVRRISSAETKHIIRGKADLVAPDATA